MEYYTTIKKDEIKSTATWMELEASFLNEQTQKKKIKYHRFLLISGSELMGTHGYKDGGN